VRDRRRLAFWTGVGRRRFNRGTPRVAPISAQSVDIRWRRKLCSAPGVEARHRCEAAVSVRPHGERRRP
jgi:hypothetical protein